MRRRHEKKAQEKEERWQRRIIDFFPWIKKEPNDDYDGDDEMSKFPVVMVMGCHSITPPEPSSTTSPNGRCLATPSKDITALPSPRVRRSPTPFHRMPTNDGGKTLPGLLNKISPSVMPAGTFFPILVSFESISCAARSSSEVSRNLLQTFQEALMMSPNESPSGKAAVISSTLQYGCSPIRTSFDDYLGLMINKEVETDSCIRSDMNTQIEVEPVNQNAELDKMGEEKGIPQFKDNQTQTDLIVEPVNQNAELDKMEEHPSI